MNEMFDPPNDSFDALPEDHPARLIAVFSLDAVDASEAAVVEEYVRHHPDAVSELASYREVAAWLGYSSAVAPDGLWDRIEASLTDTAPNPGPELAKVLSMPAPPTSPTPPASDQVTSSRWPSTRWWFATAAAVVIAVAASAVLLTPSAVSDPLQVAVEQLREDRDVRIASLVTAESPVAVEALIDLKGHGYLLAGDLPRLGRDQTYQLWGVIGDQVISLGVLGPTPSLETFTARADLRALAITIEPAGGVISDGNPDGAFVGEVT
jgi:anti-sigma-K factor RskA